jgi:NAD(P)-dependent dehydrogenase (short-subunit alcohol dehydrogenase family)
LSRSLLRIDEHTGEKGAMMPRPLAEQVIVLTGASSGIGREAALLFGRRGASVVLAARDEEALREVAREVEAAGGRALAVATDVADGPQVERLAHAAVERFGRIDTWVNEAGDTRGGTVAATAIAEIERVFRVSVLGTIHGVKAALSYMIEQGEGTIINVGAVSDGRALPLPAIQGAIKHAIAGLTEGLRLEFWKKRGDFHVTYIAPPDATGSDEELRPRLPAFDPRIIAESIVLAAQHPRRHIGDGDGARFFDVMERISPAFTDWLLTPSDGSSPEQSSEIPTGAPDDHLDQAPSPRTAQGTRGDEADGTNLYRDVSESRPVSRPAILGALGLRPGGSLEGRNDPFGGMN